MKAMTAGRGGRKSERALDLKLFALLMVGAAVGIVAVLPYQLAVLGTSVEELGVSLPVLVLLSLIQGLVLVGIISALGLWLGQKIGLGAPDLRGLLAGEPEARERIRAYIVPAILSGLLVGAAILLLDLLIFSPLLRDLAPAADAGAVQTGRTWWQGFLASFYGGIVEELLMRLGLMTIIAWIGTRLTRAARPGAAVMWTAIIVAALLFGIGHLPTAAAIMPMTPLTVGRILLLNGLGGLVFGWLYWRRGLGAAIIAHFSADIVLHVLAAALLA